MNMFWQLLLACFAFQLYAGECRKTKSDPCHDLLFYQPHMYFLLSKVEIIRGDRFIDLTIKPEFKQLNETSMDMARFRMSVRANQTFSRLSKFVELAEFFNTFYSYPGKTELTGASDEMKHFDLFLSELYQALQLAREKQLMKAVLEIKEVAAATRAFVVEMLTVKTNKTEAQQKNDTEEMANAYRAVAKQYPFSLYGPFVKSSLNTEFAKTANGVKKICESHQINDAAFYASPNLLSPTTTTTRGISTTKKPKTSGTVSITSNFKLYVPALLLCIMAYMKLRRND